MAFARPSLQEIVDRVTADFESRLALSGAVLRRSVVYVVARVIAGVAHMLYGFIDFLSRQIFPDTSETSYLERQASLKGIQRIGATFASGPITVTGTNGVTVQSGLVLQRADEAQFKTTGSGVIAGGAATVPAEAVLAGAAGNTPAGVALTFVSPVAGINATALTAAPGLAGGADQESDDSLRMRLAERLKAPPLGGAIHDYVHWAKEVAGVTRVWVSPLEGGAGTVTVRFVRDDDPVSIIPDAAAVAAVQAHIDAVRPVTAIVTVAAPIADALDFEITIAPATDAVKAAVEAELRDLLKREAAPGGTILLSHIREAISIAAGEIDHTLIAPTANVAAGTGHMAVFGAITWS